MALDFTDNGKQGLDNIKILRIWFLSNSTPKASLRGEDCPSLVRTNLAIYLVDVGSQHTPHA
jgi:hypothetical protein